MRHTIRLSAQEQYLRGDTALQRWEHARQLGFDALELRAGGEGHFAARLPELKEAAAAGVPCQRCAWRCGTLSATLMPTNELMRYSR